MNGPTKTFEIADVLSVTTGRMLGGCDGLYAILNWLTEDNLFTHQLPRASDECKPWLLRWHAALADVTVDRLDVLLAEHKDDPQLACEAWVIELIDAGLPSTLELPRIPKDDHDVIDPWTEIVSMRGTDEGIIPVVVER